MLIVAAETPLDADPKKKKKKRDDDPDRKKKKKDKKKKKVGLLIRTSADMYYYDTPELCFWRQEQELFPSESCTVVCERLQTSFLLDVIRHFC